MPDIKTTLARDIEAENLNIRFTITLPGGSKTKIIINIEAQRKSNPGYSLLNRGIFYAARLILAQLSVEFTNDGSDTAQYDNIKKVYIIWDGLTTIDAIRATGRYTAEELSASLH